MKTLIVIYELAKPALNRERLNQKIRAQTLWARLAQNTYLIKTNWTVVQVRNDLKKVLKNGDKLFVGNCPVPAAWYGQPEDVGKWILENQPNP